MVLATASALHGPPAIKGVGVKKNKIKGKKKREDNFGRPHNGYFFFANASLEEVEEIPCITHIYLEISLLYNGQAAQPPL